MRLRWCAWLGFGVLVGIYAAVATVEANLSVRGEQGARLLAWFFAAEVVFVLAAGAAYEGLRWLGARRVEAPAILEVCVAAAILVAIYVASAGVVSGELRWGVRVVLAVAGLGVVPRLAARLPAQLGHVAALGLGLALALGVVGGGFQVVSALTFEAESRPADSVQRGPARRVLWIAIDGADWSRMEALFASGRLPHLKRLRDEGATAPLETLFPTWSPRIWTSLATGRAPESHGVLDFVEYRARGGACGVQRLRRQNRLPAGLGLHRVVEALIAAGQLSQMPVTSCQRRVPSLWNIASSAGVRSTTVGWYASWPTDPVNGYIVSDLNPIRAAFRDLGFRFRDEVGNEAREAAARTGLTAPPSLLGELVANVEIPNIPDDPEAILALPFFEELTEEQRARESERSLLQVFRSIYQSDVFSVGSTEYLFRRDPGDLVSVYFSGVDNTSHRFTQPGVVDRYYDVADEFVGRLVAAAGPDVTTLIVSDHGWAYADLVDERFGHGHAPDGIFILHGPEIPALRLKAKPHVYDVAPTLLALLGLPADERMEGRAVLEALPEAARAESRRPRVDYGSYAYTPAASVAPDEVLQDEMMHRLKALGYVDE